MIAGFIAATGLCLLVMFSRVLDWPRSLLYQIPFFRKMLVCSLCTGTWCGVFLMLDPMFRVWWFPFGCSAVAWLSTLSLIRLTGIDPTTDTGRKGQWYARRWACGVWDCVEIVESNLFFIRYRDVTDPNAPCDGEFGTMSAIQFDAVYDHKVEPWGPFTKPGGGCLQI